MEIIRLKPGRIPDQLADAIEAFDARFVHPLEDGRSFKKVHSHDPTILGRSIGRTAAFVALQDGTVLGSSFIATKSLLLPSGSRRWAAYSYDLKVIPEARMGSALNHLQQATRRWAFPLHSLSFSLIIQRANLRPHKFTGRYRIPKFEPLAEVVLADLPSAPFATEAPRPEFDADERTVRRLLRKLNTGHVHAAGGRPSLRAEWPVQWLAAPDASACACLEDTRLAKRLTDEHGADLPARHLSFLAANSTAALLDIIREGLARTAAEHVPSLYVTLEPDTAEIVRADLTGGAGLFTPVTVFGHTFHRSVPKIPWRLNASEL